LSHLKSLSFHSVFLTFFSSSTIFAFIAFAVLPALQTSLVAFAVLFQTERFFAIATFKMLIIIYFLAERIWVSIH